MYILDIDNYYFFVMRENSIPQWEDITNRNGGICSLRVVKNVVCEIVEQLGILVLNESISDNPTDINGISFGGIKNNYCVIKLWNTDCANDTKYHIPDYMCRKYKTYPRYKKNSPEF